MPEKLRCGVIGAGAIGLEHLHSLSSCPRAVAVAVADISPQRGREACDRYKIARCYTDYRELLDQPDIEAVIVAVPNHLHAEVAIHALQARKHVLLEKPFALNLKEARKVVDIAQKMRCTLMVAQNFRFHPQTQMVRSMIQKGEVGEIYHIRTFWLRTSAIPRIGSWFTQRKLSGGGCIYDLGVHTIDLALHLLNDFNVVSVCGATHARFGPRGRGEGNWGKGDIDPARPFDVEDYGSAFLKMKNGKTIWMEVCWAGYHPQDTREFGLDLFGTEAGISLFPGRLFRQNAHGFETTLLNLPKVPYAENAVHHFVQCALYGKKPMVTLEESLKVQEILDSIYLSAKSGKEVRM